MQEDELFREVKAKMDANKKGKIRSRVFAAFAVFIMLAGTAAAGTLLETVNAPHVGIQATTTGGLSGDFEILLKSAPTTLNIGEYGFVEFDIKNNYNAPVLIRCEVGGFSIDNATGAHPPYPYTITEGDVQAKILQYELVKICTSSTGCVYSNHYDHFTTTGTVIPAGYQGTIKMRIAMPSGSIESKNAWGDPISYTIQTGDTLNINLQIDVESI